MTIQIGARLGSMAIVSVLFGAGCIAGDTMGDQNALDNGASSGATGAGAGPGSTVANPVAITSLSSDETNKAPNVAPAMVNAWGMVAYNGMFWIADAGSGKISIVDGKGAPATGKLASGTLDLGKGITGIAVTGLAADDMTAFQLHNNGTCAAAQLIVASEGGKLFGINTDVSTTQGFVMVDRSGAQASYKGVAVIPGHAAQGTTKATGPLVLAADFHNARIDVFDASLSLVATPTFVVPSMPAGFAPFNVMMLANTIYVAYAKQDADKKDATVGVGLGFIAAFDSSGKLLGTAKGDQLNVPWGMAMATQFAAFPNALLVGNFGDGAIIAIDPVQLTVLGQLVGTTGAPAKVDGLWGLSFSAGVTNGRADGLYFAAGPATEMHGLFGVIAPAPVP